MSRLKNWVEASGLSVKEIWEIILFPVILTRLVWELVGYYASGNYLPNPTYAYYHERGYFLTHIFPADIFARWDAEHYMSILKHGYYTTVDLTRVQSNVAFFPLYPWLVKSVGWLGINLPDGFYILLGIVFSNLFFLAAALLMVRLSVRHLGFSPDGTKKGLLLLIAFPAGFFFSSFYPESLFLFLSLAALLLAFENRWIWAGFCCALAIFTRIQGIVLFAALLWLYFEKRGWRVRDIGLNLLWAILPVIAFLGHWYQLYQVTGSAIAFFLSQEAWGRNTSGLLGGIWTNINGPALDVFKIDLILAILFLACVFFLLRTLKWKAVGIYCLLLILMPIATGSLVSMSRFLLIVFPVFLFLGERLKERTLFWGTMAAFYALQIMYFAGWVNYYWIA